MSNDKERPQEIKIFWPASKKGEVSAEEYTKADLPMPIVVTWPPKAKLYLEEEAVAAPVEAKPPAMIEGIALKREYDYVGGDIRFKVAVQNISRTVMTDINVILNPTSQYQVDDRIKMVNFLKPGETRGVDFMLTPLTCGKSMIYGTATYVDPFGNPHSATINPKEIWVKCPLVKAESVEESRIDQLKKTLQKASTTFNISGVSKTQAFKSAREQVAALDVAEAVIDTANYQAIFSGIAKVGGDELLVELSIGNEMALDVYTKDIRQATGFLAYIKNLVNLSIEVIKKLGVKVERISEQVLNCFDINQRIVELCNSCRCLGHIDDIVILLKEINSKNKGYFVDCPIIDPVNQSIVALQKLADLSQPIELRLSADIQYNSISEWMPYFRDTAETNIRIYNETFSEYSEVSDKMENGLKNLHKIMEEIERNYSSWIVRYLLVIEKRSGLTIFSKKFGQFDMDTDLVSGFLTAIQSFGSELSQKETAMRKLSYQDFEIELEEGDYVRTALVMQGKVTKYLVKNLFDYVKEFEKKFPDRFSPFDGNISVFESANDFTDKILFSGLDAGTCEVAPQPIFIPLKPEPTAGAESESETMGIPDLGKICPDCGMPMGTTDQECPRCGKKF